MTKKIKIKNIIYLILLSFFVIYFLINNTNIILAQEKSPDAIAIRIIANPEHYSAMTWYKKQNFQGSPQSLLVDGYSAIRDGRTVYVNVANIDDPNLWTNIYFISYNQKAESATIDIFGQILNHWKFNKNITQADTDICKENNSIFCNNDNECPIGDYCYSKKARIIRDVKRLENLSEINIKLEEYYNLKEHYPILGAGTYLPNKSLSVWPSWKDEFSNEIGMSLPIDPINKIGECPGYNEITCWNDNDKEFATNLPAMLDNSIIYWYMTNFDGSSYEICAVIESGFNIQGDVLISPSCAGVCIDEDGDDYGLYYTGNPGLCDNVGVDCNDNDSSIGVGTTEICSGGDDEDCDGLVDCHDDDCYDDSNCNIETCNHDGICQSDLNETCPSCPEDFCCGNPCGDDSCDENCECLGQEHYCLADCYCGNGTIDCGEECELGDANCSSDCHFENLPCTDNDNDNYSVEGGGNCCGIDNNQPCNLGIDCDDNQATCGADCYPGNPEICDGFNNDCDGETDEGFDDDNCGLICEGNGYNYNESRGGDLRCCGDDDGEGGPYQSTEENFCSDDRDNDCDGTCDITDNACGIGSIPDTDCLACNTGNNTDESFWYVAGQPDCDQCDHDGDDDGNQLPSFNGYIWGDDNHPLSWADTCDSACNNQIATSVDIDNFQLNNERNGYDTNCSDGFDNDCDGLFNCEDPDCATSPVCVVCTDVDDDDYSAEGGGNCCGATNDQPCNIETDCNDDILFINPGEEETCDGYDNNCDIDIDEGCDDDGDRYCDDSMLYFDNYGAPDFRPNPCNNTVDNSTLDCDDSLSFGAFSNPGIMNETAGMNCYDGHDNDCDDDTDCADSDCSTDPLCVTGNSCEFPFIFPCDF